MSRLRATAAAMTIACAAPTAWSALIVNGGFETGDFTGWTLAGDSSFSGVIAGIEHSGDYAAFFGPDPVGSISQAIDTAAAGAYVVSFWLALDDSAQPNSFTVRWGGVDVASFSDVQGFDYTYFSVLVPGGSASTLLEFEFSNPQSFWRIDDIDVAVPAPATPALAMTALLLLASVARRRRPPR